VSVPESFATDARAERFSTVAPVRSESCCSPAAEAITPSIFLAKASKLAKEARPTPKVASAFLTMPNCASILRAVFCAICSARPRSLWNLATLAVSSTTRVPRDISGRLHTKDGLTDQVGLGLGVGKKDRFGRGSRFNFCEQHEVAGAHGLLGRTHAVVGHRAANEPRAQVLTLRAKGLDLVVGQPLGELGAADRLKQLAYGGAQRQR
jgi:hypothetical protein